MNLSSKRTVIWTTPPQQVSAIGAEQKNGEAEVEDYRFTLGSCTTVDMGRYWAAMRAFDAWFEQENGQSYEAARSSKDADVSSQALSTWLRAHNHASIMASLRGLERRTRSVEMTNGNAPAWTPAEIPAEWQSQQDFEANAPFAIVASLTETANAVNPGLWRSQEDEEAKKNGGVSANW
jgi:hypothetical protein